MNQETPAPNPTLHPSAYMTAEQAELLATLIELMRPTWHARGIVAALEKEARKTDAITLALAMLHAAKNPNSKTPGIIHHPGPHWDAAQGLTTPGPPKPPTPAPGIDTSPMCENHPELHHWECRTCNTPTPPPPNFRDMIRKATETARSAPTPDTPTNEDDNRP